MSPNQLAFVRRQTVQVAAITPDVNAIIRDDGTGPETILLFGLLIQSALSLISPNEFSSFLFVTADDRRRRVGFKSGLILPHQRAIVGVQTVDSVIQIADYQPIANDAGRRLCAVRGLEFPDYAPIVAIQAIDVTVRRSEINPIANN